MHLCAWVKPVVHVAQAFASALGGGTVSGEHESAEHGTRSGPVSIDLKDMADFVASLVSAATLAKEWTASLGQMMRLLASRFFI